MEIYNNIVEKINRTGWSDIYYDTMLRNGRKLWAVAADDNHSGNKKLDFTPVKSVYLKNSVWHCPHQLSFNDDITHVEFKIDKTWTYIGLEITDTNGYKALGNPYFIS